ncbi:hypothetical protein HQ865_11805 [Mucilaginibacter mali]|uniref:Uncharacterized protein n=1 Tax=Mucilaginibacter mali TaxID=2740462 RepID=A0A7D4Q814_9SPHI|nr:hypothetical protein [Mucilaginibacter mali]QKJ30411.1 hypothetical protein HQ865_11805 [Mucilaginibacter mali]
MNKFIQLYPCFLLLVSMLFIGACSQPAPKQAVKQKPQASFKKVWGVEYTEVRRYFNTGYSFNEKGYELDPNWRFSFPSDDSVRIYNPKRKMFVIAPVTFDHDSVFNIAWAYMRLKMLTRDSLIFQVLHVSGKVIDNEGSSVYLTAYSNDYIKNVLHKNPLDMQVFTRKDTLFIKRKVAEATADHHKAFAARKMAELKSISPMVKVEQVINDDRADTDNDGPPIDYLSPEYNITISKAYDDFSYYFTIYVDERGGMEFGKSMVPLEPEFAQSYPRIMKGLVAGYLKAYLKVKPGTTLGIPHTSEVIVNVKGTK